MNDNSPQPQRVLVTGARGASGTSICHHLLARGHQVCGFALDKNPDLADCIVGEMCARVHDLSVILVRDDAPQNTWRAGMPFPHE